jgi:hypothetical protein
MTSATVDSKKNYGFIPVLLFIWLLFLQSCTQSDYKKPVDDFQKSTDQAATAINTLYLGLNTLERDLYFQDLLLTPSTAVAATNAGKPTLLLSDQFSSEGLAARTRLIQQLADYAHNLSKLAGNDAPAQFKSNITKLGTSLGDLQQTFQNLSKSGDKEASKYIAPLTTIVGIIGQEAVKKKQESALENAVLTGEAPINNLLGFLMTDLDNYVTTTQITGVQGKLAGLVVAYNTDRSKLSFEQRQQRLEAIRTAADAYRVVQQRKTSNVILGMKKTHEALVKAVKSKSQKNLGELLAAMESYESDVRELVEAVSELQTLLK